MGVLKNKTCIVTGAARGIGASLATQYAELGANVVLIDINEERLKEVEKKLIKQGTKVLALTTDVTCEREIKKAIETIEGYFTTIDILANCAGISTSKVLIDVDVEEWEKVFNVNLKSVFILSKFVAKSMIKNKVENGKIVSISSQASKVGEHGNGVYCASKAGVNSLTQVLALELAEYGISVNAVCPGFVDTEMLRDVFDKRSKIHGKSPADYKKELTDQVPLKRLASPDEIANFMVYLSSNDANYITGTALTIAGGKTLI